MCMRAHCRRIAPARCTRCSFSKRLTRSSTVKKRARCPFRIDWVAIATARWVLPVPGKPTTYCSFTPCRSHGSVPVSPATRCPCSGDAAPNFSRRDLLGHRAARRLCGVSPVVDDRTGGGSSFAGRYAVLYRPRFARSERAACRCSIVAGGYTARRRRLWSNDRQGSSICSNPLLDGRRYRSPSSRSWWSFWRRCWRR